MPDLVPSLTDWCTRTPQNAKHVALCAITDQFQRVPRLRNASADVALPPFRKEEAVRYGRPHEWDVSRDLHWAVCDVDPNPYVARLLWFFKGDFSCVKSGETYDDAGCGEKLRYRCQKHEVTNLGTRELYLDIATLHTDRHSPDGFRSVRQRGMFLRYKSKAGREEPAVDEDGFTTVSRKKK